MTISKKIRKAIIILPIAGVMLFSSVNVNAELGDSLLKKGVNNEDVVVLKEKLIQLNFLSIDAVNSNYDDATVKAVKDFQSFYGLSEDGMFGKNTFATLQKVEKITPLEYTRTLESDVKGEDVKLLQQRLQVMGFLHIDDIDSTYGPKTKQAVLNFQEVYKLQADGIAGAGTIEAINQALSGNKRMKRPQVSRSGANSKGQDLISTAKRYIGTPYRFGGTTSKGFDCSGFTQAVFKSQGISIPRATSGQSGFGTKVSRSELQTGDLVIFSGTYKAGPSHAGIYIGNGDFIHSSSARGVTISSLNENYYSKHFSYGRRVY